MGRSAWRNQRAGRVWRDRATPVVHSALRRRRDRNPRFAFNTRVRPAASTIGALAYVFSPFVVSDVIPNPIYLAALAILPALLAVVLAGAKGIYPNAGGRISCSAFCAHSRLRLRQPAVARNGHRLCLCDTRNCVLDAWTDCCQTGTYCAGTRFLLATAVSAYWTVPAFLHLPSFAKDQLAAISSWSWTQGRATLQNAFWLNNTWSWSYPEYYPFASTYDDWPLKLLRFGPAILAFAALLIANKATRVGFGHLRVTVLASTVALAVILISTGTNPPGNVVSTARTHSRLAGCFASQGGSCL